MYKYTQNKNDKKNNEHLINLEVNQHGSIADLKTATRRDQM